MITSEQLSRLSGPVPPEEIRWKVQVVDRERGSALVVPYVDARFVATRLDEAVSGDWSWQWEPVDIRSDRLAVKGTLVVCGVARSDVGEYAMDEDSTDPWKAAVSDALKRTAVLFGVGRDIYGIAPEWVRYDVKTKRVAPGEIERIRTALAGEATRRTAGAGRAPQPASSKAPVAAQAPVRAAAEADGDTEWTRQREASSAFWSWAHAQGWEPSAVLAALGVARLDGFTGTKAEALQCLRKAGLEPKATEAAGASF